MTSLEHELHEKISRLDQQKQRRVLDFVRSLEELPPERTYSARDLMKLPLHERNQIVIKALERSADEDIELFEAYSESDLDDE